MFELQFCKNLNKFENNLRKIGFRSSGKINKGIWVHSEKFGLKF